MLVNRITGLIVVAILMLVYGCSKTATEPPSTTNLGDVNLNILLNNVGSLSKTATIDLENLYIELSNGTTTILDTVAVSGNTQVIVNNSYTELVEGAWSVIAESRDVNDIIIHSDSTTFTVIPANSVDVSLSLTSKYSMIIANFVGIADSVSRCELLVDAALVADSSFAAQSAVGSTLSLNYDYLSTGVEHTIKLDAYGDMWGTEHLLYTGDTTVTVVAGVDNSYAINLDWIGPNEAPPGTAAVEITIGPTGTLTVNGDFVTPAVTVTDIDGNIYSTVTIGNQVWLAENLKVTKYRDGTPITNVTDAATWGNLTTEAYCYYNNNSGNEADTYGAMYNWYALSDIRNIAPEGWHVSTDEEWSELIDYLGGDNIAGSKLAGNADLWNDGGLENDSEFGTTGFTALPGGYRWNGNGNYENMGNMGYFWSATENSSTSGWFRKMHFTTTSIYRYDISKRDGFAVRLLRD